MRAKVVRWIFARRNFFKRFLFIRRPVLLKLNDFKMYVRLDDWAVGARIAVKRSYEPEVTRAMREALKPGMVMLDLGANIGYYSLLAASRIGPQGKVIAFEPGRESCDLLKLSLDANGFRNVTVHNCAVADINGVVGFGVDDSNGAISRDDPAKSQYQVQAVKLDDFLKDEPRLDVVKIDIEGAEGRAIQGMQGLLTRHRPIVFTEFFPAALQQQSAISGEAYLDLLTGLGFRLAITRLEGTASEPQTREQIMQAYAKTTSDHLNLVATPAGPKG